MDKIFNWTSTVIGIVGGFFAAIFGQWDSHYQGNLHKNNVE